MIKNITYVIVCFAYGAHAADTDARLSIVIVNQPSLRKIEIKGNRKNHDLPQVTIILQPFEKQIITKKLDSGIIQRITLAELTSDTLSALLALDNDIASSHIQGILNVTPRMQILYNKCAQIYQKLITVEIFNDPTPVSPKPWYLLW